MSDRPPRDITNVAKNSSATNRAIAATPPPHRDKLGFVVVEALSFSMQIRKYVFTASLTVINRFTVVRDLLLGRIGPIARKRRARKLWFGHSAEAEITRCAIRSGNNTLDAYLVKPAASPVRAVVLICHGIGETVEHWLPRPTAFCGQRRRPRWSSTTAATDAAPVGPAVRKWSVMPSPPLNTCDRGCRTFP